DEGANAALFLGLGNGLESECRLAGGFRPVNLYHAATRQAANAERNIKAERPGRNRLDFDHLLVLAEPHDRTLAERPLDLTERGLERLLLVHVALFAPVHELHNSLRHHRLPLFHTGRARAITVNVRPLFSLARIF